MKKIALCSITLMMLSCLNVYADGNKTVSTIKQSASQGTYICDPERPEYCSEQRTGGGYQKPCCASDLYARYVAYTDGTEGYQYGTDPYGEDMWVSEETWDTYCGKLTEALNNGKLESYNINDICETTGADKFVCKDIGAKFKFEGQINKEAKTSTCVSTHCANGYVMSVRDLGGKGWRSQGHCVPKPDENYCSDAKECEKCNGKCMPALLNLSDIGDKKFIYDELGNNYDISDVKNFLNGLTNWGDLGLIQRCVCVASGESGEVIVIDEPEEDPQQPAEDLVSATLPCNWTANFTITCKNGKSTLYSIPIDSNVKVPKGVENAIKKLNKNTDRDEIKKYCEEYLVPKVKKIVKEKESAFCGEGSAEATSVSATQEEEIVYQYVYQQGNSQSTDTILSDARLKIKSFINSVDKNKTVWKTAEGKFNTARLASDLTAGVVLGTVGGVVSGVVIKKKQVEKGFDALHCTVGGQTIADWGDMFNVGLQRY